MISNFKNKFFHLKEFSKKKEVKKITSNIKWMSFEKIFRLFLSVFVSAWVARYLGPEKFGLMNYALAFVALFQAFSVLGLDEIVVRNIINQKSKKNEILGTAFVLKLTGSLFLLAFSSILIIFVRPENQLLHILVVIVALGYVFKSFDTIDLWFRSQLQSKYTAIAKSIAFFTSSVIKIFLILVNASLVAFVWAFMVDFVLAGLLLLVIYQNKNKDIFSWKLGFSEAKGLLKDCWPLILSGVAVALHMNIDKIMVGKFLGDSEVGIYSAATRVVLPLSFIVMSINNSVFPSILKAKSKGKVFYKKRFQNLFDLVIWVSIIMATLFSLFSDLVVNLLFGSDYSFASLVLSVLIWGKVFNFFGSSTSKYVIAENITKISFFRALMGALVNISLNLIFIPIWGVVGAALSTLVSVFFQGLLSMLLFKKTRPLFYMFFKSFNLVRVLKDFKLL